MQLSFAAGYPAMSSLGVLESWKLRLQSSNGSDALFAEQVDALGSSPENTRRTRGPSS